MISIFFAVNVHAQQNWTKVLSGEWFVGNLDSSFFRADTLIFVKRTNYEQNDAIKRHERRFLEPETELVKSHEYINIHFKKSRNVEFCLAHQGGYWNECWNAQIKWSVKADRLHLYADKFRWTFRILSTGSISFKHLVSNSPQDVYETLSTLTMTIIRVK